MTTPITIQTRTTRLMAAGYLDADGDGAVTAADELLANDQVGDKTSPFQVQAPDGHFYASTSGDAMACPQPDLGITPGERTNWTPEPSEDPPAG